MLIRATLFVLLLQLSAWAQTVDPIVQFEVSAMLQASANAWNRGQLDDFMTDYLPTSELTFTSGGNILQGYDTLRERYSKKYGEDRASMGHLTFSDIKAWKLGAQHALALGEWHLKREGKPESGGVFSLVMVKTDRGWKIFHDHTSQFAEKP